MGSISLRVAGALFLFAAAARGQSKSPIHEGGWIVDGSAHASRNHDNDAGENTTNIALAPSGLRFITPGLAVGGTISLGYNTNAAGHSSTYGIGPSARYYLGDAHAAWLPYASVTAFPLWLNAHQTVRIAGGTFDENETSRATSLDGAFGLTRLIAASVGVTAEAYYTHTWERTTQVVGGTSLDLGGYSFGVRFGIVAFAR